MSGVLSVGVSAVTPAQAGYVSNAQAAARAAAAPAPRVSFRTLLLEREAEVADRRLGTAPPLSVSTPASLLPAAPSARVAHGASGPGKSRATEEDDLADPSSAHAVHRRAGELEPDAAWSVPPPVTTPPPFTVPASDPQVAASARATASLEDLLPALVRRIAWSSDGQRGSVRLEIGAGELAGATLLVHADAGRVSVHMDVPPGTDAALWERRLRERLASRGLTTDTVEVQ
jgi:hypothetical protein